MIIFIFSRFTHFCWLKHSATLYFRVYRVQVYRVQVYRVQVYRVQDMAPITPFYPPGVFQTFVIPDPTSLDGLGDMEITLIPFGSQEQDKNFLVSEGIIQIKEMLYEADEEYRHAIDVEMDSITTLLESMRIRAESIGQDNAIAIREGRQPSLWFTLGCKYGLPAPWDIRDTLDDAEEDAEYEAWIKSKQYIKSLEEYNRHKLLAWNKEEEGGHPKWSGEYKELTQSPNHTDLLNSYIKERYNMFVDVKTLCSDENSYSKGTTPYGDVYIPNKIANYLKDGCGAYQMDIALQDVEGPPGKGPNAFRWTCVYLHNNGYSVE